MTRYIRHITVLIGVVCGVIGATAQTDPQFTQFYEVPSYYNPAAIGQTEHVRIRAGARLQWMGVENAPTTFAGVADMRLKLLNKFFGLGLAVQQESAGLFSNITLGVQLGYKFKFLKGEWTVGIQPGLINEKFKGSETFIPDDDDYHQSTDEAIPTSDVAGTKFDLGAGIWYKHPYVTAGVSLLHALSPTINFSAEGSGGQASGGAAESEQQYQFTARRTLYFMAMGNIPIKNTLFEILPSVMAKSDFQFTSAEIMARVRYNKFISAGVGYRWKDAVTATVAAEVKNFFIGYSFDYSLSEIGAASYGSHELFVGYSLKLDMGDKNKNKHKSIRIM